MSFKTMARLGPLQLQRIVRDPITQTAPLTPMPPGDVAGIRFLFPVWAARRHYYDFALDQLHGRRWQWFIVALTFARRNAPQVAVSLSWAWVAMGAGQ